MEFRGESTFMKLPNILIVKRFILFYRRKLFTGVNFSRLLMKWSCTSKLQILKLNPVELQPLSFWSKLLLPKWTIENMRVLVLLTL